MLSSARWKKLRGWLIGAAAVVALVVLVVLVLRTRHSDRPVLEPEERSAPAMPAEEIVERYILGTAPDPDSVRFARWGPHDLTGELVTHRKGSDDRILRVRYESKNRQGQRVVEDDLFYLLDGEVNQVVTNLWGDQWREAMRKLNERPPGLGSPVGTARGSSE